MNDMSIGLLFKATGGARTMMVSREITRHDDRCELNEIQQLHARFRCVFIVDVALKSTMTKFTVEFCNRRVLLLSSGF